MNEFEAARLRYERRRGLIPQTGGTMKVERIAVDKLKARELYQEYKKHQHYSEPIDAEIQRTYKVLAQGRTVIQAIKSIEVAGLGDDKMPKLAIARADAKTCLWRTHNGHGVFHTDDRWSRARAKTIRANFPGMTYNHPEGQAIVPLIPVHLRPKRGLPNYHILWEADWKAIPKDPYLLRRIGGDMWLVVAAWDLTDVERAAMANRLSA